MGIRVEMSAERSPEREVKRNRYQISNRYQKEQIFI